MADRKQHRAIAERRHIQTEINRRLSRASRVAQIMHINMLHERSHALSNIYSASVFSYRTRAHPCWMNGTRKLTTSW